MDDFRSNMDDSNIIITLLHSFRSSYGVGSLGNILSDLSYEDAHKIIVAAFGEGTPEEEYVNEVFNIHDIV